MTGMDMPDPRILAALVAILMAVGFYFLRRDRHRASAHRVARLNRVAELLSEHAVALQHFLEDTDAPAELKALLIGFSDAMEKESVAVGMAEFFARLKDLSLSSEAQTLLATTAELQRTRPDLADWFARAIGTATAAGFLRWEEAARHFESAMATIVADPRRECVAAVEGARRSGISA